MKLEAPYHNDFSSNTPSFMYKLMSNFLMKCIPLCEGWEMTRKYMTWNYWLMKHYGNFTGDGFNEG